MNDDNDNYGTECGSSWPKGTTAQRPLKPLAGEMRWNTTDKKMEYYTANGMWVQIIAGTTNMPGNSRLARCDDVNVSS